MPAMYDVAILGGGPGGYATALRAAGHGLRVVVIEADALGGTCLHRGCIPSKALLHIAHLADAMPRLVEVGLATAGPGLDVSAAGAFRDRVVGQLQRGLAGLLTERKIDVVTGWGRIDAPGSVRVTTADDTADPTIPPAFWQRSDAPWRDGSLPERVVTATDIVVATGSSVVELACAPFDGRRIVCSDDVLRLERVPASAVVVGAGAVGAELATLWSSLGTHVTLVEAADRVLPLEDPDSSTALERAMRRRRIDVRTSVALHRAEAGEDDVLVELVGGGELRVDQVLVAVGRRPATAGCGLDELGVLDARGHVEVDALGRTTVAHVWAVGDVLPTLALAHAAFAEGFAVADAIAGLDPEPVDHALVPRVTFTTPEVASVGLTEPEARARYGDDIEVTRTSLAGNGRALIDGGGGHVKLLTTGDGTLVGAHVVGPGATELIGELCLATSWGALAAEVGAVTHAHPTVAEAVRETALVAAGLPFHADGS